MHAPGHETLCTSLFLPVPGGAAINTPILLALFVAILGSVIVIIGRLLVRRQRGEGPFAPQTRERTEEERAQDRRMARTWGCLALAVPLVLLALYTMTR